ncbi:hypothetical protein, partial [Bradyrhizobium sp. 188]|uniref:hypothetical protein n=1 Tax=Bradyrhizobium sp. 188 TaxID=2782656 RepID=UPI001FF74DB3
MPVYCVLSDKPRTNALAAVAPGVRFNFFAIFVTPVFCFASNFSVFRSSFVHSELSPNFGDGRSRSGGGGYGLAVGRLGDDLDPII